MAEILSREEFDRQKETWYAHEAATIEALHDALVLSERARDIMRSYAGYATDETVAADAALTPLREKGWCLTDNNP